MPYGPVFLGIWWIFPIIMLAFMVLGIFAMRSMMVDRGNWPYPPTHTAGSDALEVAKRRYAAGEITAEQLAEIRRNLER